MVIITIALMLFVGYLMTRITRKFKLPNVTGYILAGILMGPYCLDMVPVKVIDGMGEKCPRIWGKNYQVGRK